MIRVKSQKLAPENRPKSKLRNLSADTEIDSDLQFVSRKIAVYFKEIKSNAGRSTSLCPQVKGQPTERDRNAN